MRMCHAVGYSLVITRGSETEKTLYPGNITNEKEWHLHTSFPKIIIGSRYLANFILNKAILAFWLRRSLKTIEYFINLKYWSSSTSLPLRSPNLFLNDAIIQVEACALYVGPTLFINPEGNGCVEGRKQWGNDMAWISCKHIERLEGKEQYLLMHTICSTLKVWFAEFWALK